MTDSPSSNERLTLEQTADRIRRATLIEYDHGGGRLYFVEPNGTRDLIADFYGEGHYRDFIMTLLRTAAEPVEKPASWVIRERATGRVIMETFNEHLLETINPEYEMVPIERYLDELNSKLRNEK